MDWLTEYSGVIANLVIVITGFIMMKANVRENK